MPFFDLNPGSPLPPTAPIGDFNGAIIPFLHGRSLELIFGIPLLMLLVVTFALLGVMAFRHAR
jgi:hypothetical protein